MKKYRFRSMGMLGQMYISDSLRGQWEEVEMNGREFYLADDVAGLQSKLHTVEHERTLDAKLLDNVTTHWQRKYAELESRLGECQKLLRVGCVLMDRMAQKVVEKQFDSLDGVDGWLDRAGTLSTAHAVESQGPTFQCVQCRKTIQPEGVPIPGTDVLGYARYCDDCQAADEEGQCQHTSPYYNDATDSLICLDCGRRLTITASEGRIPQGAPQVFTCTEFAESQLYPDNCSTCGLPRAAHDLSEQEENHD